MFGESHLGHQLRSARRRAHETATCPARPIGEGLAAEKARNPALETVDASPRGQQSAGRLRHRRLVEGRLALQIGENREAVTVNGILIDAMVASVTAVTEAPVVIVTVSGTGTGTGTAIEEIVAREIVTETEGTRGVEMTAIEEVIEPDVTVTSAIGATETETDETGDRDPGDPVPHGDELPHGVGTEKREMTCEKMATNAVNVTVVAQRGEVVRRLRGSQH